MGIAVVSYIAAIACGVAAGYLSDGTANTVVASMMASVVFFAGTGIVLQVISSTNLSKLKVERQKT
jgi:F0F1-type ATP synthase assembly protein I